MNVNGNIKIIYTVIYLKRFISEHICKLANRTKKNVLHSPIWGCVASQNPNFRTLIEPLREEKGRGTRERKEGSK